VARTKELLKAHNANARKNLFSIIFQREQISGKLKNIEQPEADSVLVSD
jgi:hypothetical protein